MSDLYNGNVFIVREHTGFGKPSKLLIFSNLEKAECELYKKIINDFWINLPPRRGHIYRQDYTILNMQINSNSENPIPYLVTKEMINNNLYRIMIKRGWKTDWNYETNTQYEYATDLARREELFVEFLIPGKLNFL